MSHMLGWECLLSKRPEETSVGEDVDKEEPLYTVGGIVKWYNQYGKQYGGSSKNLRIERLYDPAIPLLGVYSDNMKILFKKMYVPLCSLQHYL